MLAVHTSLRVVPQVNYLYSSAPKNVFSTSQLRDDPILAVQAALESRFGAHFCLCGYGHGIAYSQN